MKRTRTPSPDPFRVTHTLRTESKVHNKDGTVDPVIDIRTIPEPFGDLQKAEARYGELKGTWDTPQHGNGTVLDVRIDKRTETLCGERWTTVRSCNLNEHQATRQ